jgi:hypothetical protein
MPGRCVCADTGFFILRKKEFFMKNIIKLIGIIAIVAVIGIAIISCDDDNETETTHTHQWGAWQGTEATCTSKGEEKRTCTLDPTHIERIELPINPNAHNWGNLTQTSEPTCTEKGKGSRTCTLNPLHNETGIEIVETTALGHTPNTETGLCTVCNALTYNLGDTGPGGGKIFYRLEAGFTQYANAADTVGTTAHYLEAAPANMPTTIEWASSGFTSTGISSTGTAIGTGMKNTALILATDTNAPAAKACNDYINGGKTDWFLPSRDELNQLYVNRTSVDNVDNMGTVSYWSSSQSSNTGSRFQNFSDGNQYIGNKGNMYSVRAVRAF